jgi:predicted DNA-binding protein (MmcQ/YjbR family)
MTRDPIERLRDVCLAFPEAVESGGVGNPSFKVRDKIFAMQHGMEGRPSLWVKAPAGLQEALIESDPATYFRPPYVGHHGWVGIWLDIELDWESVAELVDDSYRMTAPKRLAARIER